MRSLAWRRAVKSGDSWFEFARSLAVSFFAPEWLSFDEEALSVRVGPFQLSIRKTEQCKIAFSSSSHSVDLSHLQLATRCNEFDDDHGVDRVALCLITDKKSLTMHPPAQWEMGQFGNDLRFTFNSYFVGALACYLSMLIAYREDTRNQEALPTT
ncbi:MAG: hypothetical protein WD049_02045 [Candidatus Paceibacterota bacterium]